MANLDTEQMFSISEARRRARVFGHVHRAQIMLLASGLAAFGIIAVAAAMMGTLF
jgi:hypothetical protein